ncbi:MAG: hypothetical protein H6868_06990 [Rhodospirillales bacterium]|nr:hypothetical protein [Rhodospirillales bacterium]
MTDPQSYFSREPRRKAEFIMPPNILKEKVGSGGLADEIIDKAQALLENHTLDFAPLADIYLDKIKKGIAAHREGTKTGDNEGAIALILYPTMQLKANGSMFHFPLVTKIADHLIRFLEVIDELDEDILEIIEAFQTTIRAIIHGRITGDGGANGSELLQALVDACSRYFDRNPDSPTGKGQDDYSSEF